MKNNNWKYLYRIKRLEIKSWLKYLMIEGKSIIDYILGEIVTGTDITINNTVEKTFNLFNVKGNSTQETTTGKNLLPNNATTITLNGITFTINKDKSVTLNGTSTGQAYINLYISTTQSIVTDTTKSYTYSKGITNANIIIGIYEYVNNGWVAKKYATTDYTVYTPSGEQTGQMFRIVVDTGKTISNVTIYPMIVQGTTVGEYEPYTYGASPNPSYEQPIYSAGDNGSISEKIENADGTKSQTYTIPVQQPMRSIGTVRDEFVKVNGEWKERHNIGKKIFDGTESWNQPNASSYPNLFQINNIDLDFVNASNNSVSNYFIWKLSSEVTTQEGFSLFFSSNQKYMRINNSSITALQDFKTWLSTHNTEIIYQLATPQDLPCTEEQISILETLPTSYNEQTNIYSLDVTPSFLEVQAYVKKEVIEND